MNVRDEIAAIEEQLREAELAPDPSVFERVLVVAINDQEPFVMRET